MGSREIIRSVLSMVTRTNFEDEQHLVESIMNALKETSSTSLQVQLLHFLPEIIPESYHRVKFVF
jgi:hypothetical protein